MSTIDRIAGHSAQPQHLAQFLMFGRLNFRLPKGPVFLVHEAQDGQQLRLHEDPLRKTSEAYASECHNE